MSKEDKPITELHLGDYVEYHDMIFKVVCYDDYEDVPSLQFQRDK